MVLLYDVLHISIGEHRDLVAAPVCTVTFPVLDLGGIIGNEVCDNKKQEMAKGIRSERY